MAEKPMLFNTEMVKAILDGRKTQTRRILKITTAPVLYAEVTPPSSIQITKDCMAAVRWNSDVIGGFDLKPPYLPGDILWVRETWQYIPESDTDGFYVYAADREEPADWKWRPSIHMPREAARLFLRVTSVRVQRLQNITSGEAVAEGIKSNLRSPSEAADALIAFEELWNSTLKPADLPLYGWGANPWVWVIGFVRIEK